MIGTTARNPARGTPPALGSRRLFVSLATYVAAAVAGFAAVAVAPASARAAQISPDAADAGTAAPQDVTSRGIRSWTGDRREFRAGDVITVLVDERTLASANRTNIAAQDRNQRATLTAGEGGRSSAGQVVDAALRSGVTAESRDRGQATRQDRFATEVTVRVVEVERDGRLRIEGGKSIRIDDHEQQITLSGWVRPEDVSPRNIVDSWRVADSRIEYVSDGGINAPRRSLLFRLIAWVWP